MRERRHEEDDVWEGLRLTGIAVGAAIVTAAMVIAGGGVLMDRLHAPEGPARLIHASAGR